MSESAPSPQQAGEAERRRFHAELVRFEISRAYRPGWSRQAFLDRFGSSPPREWDFDAPASHVSPATYQWIRHRAAEFARSREANKQRRVSRETRQT